MVGNFNPSLANEAPSALSSSSCSAQLGMTLATYFLLFFLLPSHRMVLIWTSGASVSWMTGDIYSSAGDFHSWFLNTCGTMGVSNSSRTSILSPSGPQCPIYSVDSYCTDEDLLHQVHSPSISFSLHSISIYLSISLFLACFRGGCALRFLPC